MARPRFIELDGKKYAWKAVVEEYRKQAKAAARPEQPTLFELKIDARPLGERTAAQRFLEPNLFSTLKP